MCVYVCVYECVYVCMCVTKWARRAVAEPLVAQLSFLAHLEGQFLYSFRRCKNFCRVTWPWPIYSAPKWPLDEYRVFFTMFSRFVRKRTEISKLLQWTAIGKVGMGFPTTPKSAPQLDSFPPIWGVENMKKTRKMGFTTFKWLNSAVKFFRSKTSSGKVVCTYVWKTSAKKVSKSVHNYTFYPVLSALPPLTQMR